MHVLATSLQQLVTICNPGRKYLRLASDMPTKLDMLQELGVDPQQLDRAAVPLKYRAVHTLRHMHRPV
jgi:hypothetical protein